MPGLDVRPATPQDVPLLHAMICELADYEKLRHTVKATEGDLHRALFGPRPLCEAAVGRSEDSASGFALYFPTYSTFSGRASLYLEDLYVRPAARGRGLGRLLFHYVVEATIERGYGRVEWTALDWNEPAIRFYESLGAVQRPEWRLFRLEGAALDRFRK